MITEPVVSDLLTLLYDAAADPTSWQKFLSAVAEATQASTVTLMLHDEADNAHNIRCSYGLHPEARDLYELHFGRIDPWYLRALGQASTGWVAPGESLIATSDLIKTEFHADLLRHYDMLHECGSVIERTDSSIALLSILRGPNLGAFDENAVALLRYLQTHLRHAFALHRKLSALHVTVAAQNAVLEQFSIGIFLLSTDGMILFANRAAREIAAGHNGLTIRKSGLIAMRPEESKLLGALVRSAAKIGIGRAAGGSMVITRRESKPLAVLVSALAPASSLNLLMGPEAATVVVFVTDPDRGSNLSTDMLKAVYGLTPAEGRLACKLMEVSLNEAAEQLGVTLNTVRSQLKMIFQKTGASRQSQLVRLLSDLPPHQ